MRPRSTNSSQRYPRAPRRAASRSSSSSAATPSPGTCAATSTSASRMASRSRACAASSRQRRVTTSPRATSPPATTAGSTWRDRGSSSCGRDSSCSASSASRPRTRSTRTWPPPTSPPGPGAAHTSWCAGYGRTCPRSTTSSHAPRPTWASRPTLSPFPQAASYSPRYGRTYCSAMSQGKKIQVSWLTSVM